MNKVVFKRIRTPVFQEKPRLEETQSSVKTPPSIKRSLCRQLNDSDRNLPVYFKEPRSKFSAWFTPFSNANEPSDTAISQCSRHD